ncbi:LHFPL tetraspan subfamily member 3 protein [Amia ocellicauda]|uniref:LHFPL tetraspan subfamily member 3 protein n=1 Tax=Amia ocellicauda TaxID=2972642 RepID=UPI003464CF99
MQCGAGMAVRPLAEVSSLYQTEFVRSARAVGALWAGFSLCFSVIAAVALVQPSWVGTGELRYRPGQGEAPLAGSLGLFEVCLDTDALVPECRGSLRTLTPLSPFQSPAVLVCMALALVWASVGCLALFRFCNAATVYKVCAWLQLTAGFCLALGCVLFADSWDCAEMRALCGPAVSSFSPGRCSVGWAYVLAILGVLDAAILSTLAFVLGNRQDGLLPDDHKEASSFLLAS